MNLIATFKVPVKLSLSHEQIQEARAALNTFHLGDAEANTLNPETLVYEAKYPEKETEEFRTASTSILGAHTRYVTIGIDSRGQFCIFWGPVTTFPKMTPKDYKLELLAAIENNRDKDALTVTREFMAQKALDDLYRNNAEGMKRLADS